MWLLSRQYYIIMGPFPKVVIRSNIDMALCIVAMGLFDCKVDAVS